MVAEEIEAFLDPGIEGHHFRCGSKPEVSDGHENVCSWGKSGRNPHESGHRVPSVVLIRRFKTSLRAPLHASDGAGRYLGS